MDDYKTQWSSFNKSSNSGNFWSDLDASRSESDLSFFSNGSLTPPQKSDVMVDSSFTSYNQWSGSSFPQYSLWGSPPPTPGLDTTGSRPQTQMSNFTGNSSRSGSPEWNGSPNQIEPRWRDEPRHGSNSVMCTYDSLVPGSPWSQIPISNSSQSVNPYAHTWAHMPSSSLVNYERRSHMPYDNYEPKMAADDSFALEKLAERFQDFKLKPQMLSKRISDRKIRANLKKPACIECVFCKNNEEKETVYKSHVLKDVFGRVQCPVLRLYKCPICGQPGGDRAHTIRYCPENKAHTRKMAALNCKKEKRREIA